MATRSQIGIYKNKMDKLRSPESIIFKMHDGYIESVLPALLRFVDKMDLISADPEFKLIQDQEAITSWLNYFLINEFLNDIKKYMQDDPGLKPYYILKEIYLTKYFYQDIEFYYAFYPDRIECYEIEYTGNGDQIFNLVNTAYFNFELVECEIVEGVI